jgi:hypothetical protein
MTEKVKDEAKEKAEKLTPPEVARRAEEMAREKTEKLQQRTNAEYSSASHVDTTLDEFAEGRLARTEGLSTEKQSAIQDANAARQKALSELQGKPLNAESLNMMSETLTKEASAIIDNPVSIDLAQKEMQRCVELLGKAQTDGDIPKGMPADAAFKFLEQQLKAMGYQDMVAHENTLGDHGMRHISYDTGVFEKQMDALERDRQQPVKAIDRLMGRVALQIHDLGYANDDVRRGINAGEFGIDNGHAIMGSRYVREKAADVTDPMAKVFSQSQLGLIHEGILTHDYSDSQFSNLSPEQQSDQTPEGKTLQWETRKGNIIAAMRIADNTHAFEDKLPEVLYAVPESLKYLRYMKTIGETFKHLEKGDETSPDAQLRKGLLDNARKGLKASIESNESFTPEERKALLMAADNIHPGSYKFSVGRICGNQPQIKFDEEGRVEITVQESAIHQEAVELFGMDAHDQLVKFCKDVTGVAKDEVKKQMADGKVSGKSVVIKTDVTKKVKEKGQDGQVTTTEVQIGQGKSQAEETDYQKQIRTLLNGDERFKTYIQSENRSLDQQKRLQGALADETADGQNKRLNEAADLKRKDNDTRSPEEIVRDENKTPEDIIKDRLEQIRKERVSRLEKELGGVEG